MHGADGVALCDQFLLKKADIFDVKHQLDQGLTGFLALACGMEQQDQPAVWRLQFYDAITVLGDGAIAKQVGIKPYGVLWLFGIKDNPVA